MSDRQCLWTKNGATLGLVLLAFAGLDNSSVLAKDAQSYVGTAQTYAEKGNLKAAEIELRNAVREAPQDAHIHALLAQVYLRLGEFSSAEREARSARGLNGAESDYLLTLADAMSRQSKFADIPVEIKPGNRAPELESKVRLFLAMAAAGMGDRAKSEALLREAVAVDPNTPGPKIALARQLLGKNIPESEKLVEEVLAKDPRSTEAIAVKGEILIVKGDTDGAIQRFGEALAIDPNSQSARLGRANVNLSRGDYGSVDNDIDPILKASPENFAANYLRALEHFKKKDFGAADKVLDRLSPGFSNLAEGLYVQAATKYSLGQYGQASDAIAKYVARVPGNPFGARLAALIAVRRGAPDVAIQYLTGYLEKAQPDPGTLTLLGNIYATIRKPTLALEQYQKAAALEPENPTIKTMVAASEIDTGAGQKGLEELEQVFSTDSGATIAGPTLVLTDLRAGQVDKAAQVAEELIKRDSNNQLYQVLLGIVKTAQRNYPAAETIFKALVDKAPDFGPARANLAQVYVLAGNIDEARKTYQDFLVRNPNDVSVLLGVADVAAREKKWNEAVAYANRARTAASSNPAPGLKLLDLYAAQQDWEQAKRLASELSVQFPSNAEIAEAQGRILAASGDPDGAIESYRRAFELAPKSTPILSRYLSALGAAKRFPEYRTILQSRLDKDPGNRSLKAQLVRTEAEIGGLEAGLAKARSFAKDEPDSSVYDLVSAELYERAGKRSDAINLLQKRASARPSDNDVTIALSGLYSRAGNSEKAEAVLSSRLKDQPDATSIRAVLGDFYIRNNKFDAALREEAALVAARPDDPAILNNLAWLYQQMGDLPKALELAKKASSIAPGNGSIADTLGWILLGQGEAEKALTHLQAASSANPGDPEIRYHVAVALDRLGRTADARAMLEQLLGSGASFSSKDKAEKLLDELKRG